MKESNIPYNASLQSRVRLVALIVLVIACGLRGVELPMELESLKTSKGKVYDKVTVREVTPSGIRIFHEAGAASIPFEELTLDLRQKLGGFDPEKAKLHRETEQKSLRAYEQSIDLELQNMGKAAEETNSSKPLPESPATAKPQAAEDKKVNRGQVSARIVGYRDGVKNVEFRARANCAATLVVHQVAPHRTTERYTVSANSEFVREVSVFNNYSTELLGEDGRLLDKEGSRNKTELGGSSRPRL